MASGFPILPDKGRWKAMRQHRLTEGTRGKAPCWWPVPSTTGLCPAIPLPGPERIS